MEKEKLIALLQQVYDRKVQAHEAFEKLQHLPYEDLGFAKVDHLRAIRNGNPEVIFCQGKALSHILEILKRLLKKNSVVLLTRADEKVYRKVSALVPQAEYHALSRTITIVRKPPVLKGKVGVISAGTADIPVAEEVAVTARIFGCQVEQLFDVGVAGLHRLLDGFKKVQDSRCLVVVAGMDGALPSVVGGLASCPVIAVPTSVGYGSHFEGLASLLTMLNTCSPNVSVVNIDNGFGAGYMASLINRMEK